jgi:hypothetical protein
MSDGFSPGIVGSKMVSRRITGYPPKWEYTYRDYLKWLTEQPKPEAMSNE